MSCELISDIKANSHSPSFATSGVINSVDSQYLVCLWLYIRIHTWPQTARFSDHKADMLWTLFHLTGEVECCGEHKVWACLSNLILGIVSLEIHLGCCNGLLSGGHTFAELDKLYDLN